MTYGDYEITAASFGGTEVTRMYYQGYLVFGGEETPGDYLTLYPANDTMTFTFIPEGQNTLEYSLDDGETWSAFTGSVEVDISQAMRLRGQCVATSNGIGRISGSDDFTAYGNIMSLLYPNFGSQTSLSGKNNAFTYLFSGSSITDVSNLSLPATTLSNGCYQGMFLNCTGLTTYPSELPATAVTPYAYTSMFEGCELIDGGPLISATTLSSFSLYRMFYGCTNLGSVSIDATDISANSCTLDWLGHTNDYGTLIKPAEMENWTCGDSGIPQGWMLENSDGTEATQPPCPEPPVQTECVWLNKDDSWNCLGNDCVDGDYNCVSIFIPSGATPNNNFIGGPLSAESSCWVFEDPIIMEASGDSLQLRICYRRQFGFGLTYQIGVYYNGEEVSVSPFTLAFTDYDDETQQYGCYVNIKDEIASLTNYTYTPLAQRYTIPYPYTVPVDCKLCVAVDAEEPVEEETEE